MSISVSSTPTHTPLGSPQLEPASDAGQGCPVGLTAELDEIEKIEDLDGKVHYNIPPAILKRLTPVSPQKKSTRSAGNKLVEERAKKLKDYTERIEAIHEQQKMKMEKKRRLSNEVLQRRLDNASYRRSKANSAKSKRAAESFKTMSGDDLASAVSLTKSMLKRSNGQTEVKFLFPKAQSHGHHGFARDVIRMRAKVLSSSGIFLVLGSPQYDFPALQRLITNATVIESVSSIFELLEIPVPAGNHHPVKLFLQSFHYLNESANDDKRTSSLNTNLPPIKDREPFNSIFDNSFYSKIVVLLTDISRKMVTSFQLLMASSLNKLKHPYLSFIRLWRSFCQVNFTFLKIHSVRLLASLNYSKQVLLKSKHLLESKLDDQAYATIKDDIGVDVKKYDDEVDRLSESVRNLQHKAEVPSIGEIYAITKLLKANRKVYTERDMYPTFVKSMRNWRMLIMREEYYGELSLGKQSCSVLDSAYEHEFSRCLSQYAEFCKLLQMENYVETLSQEQDLTEFGVRLLDFLNNSLHQTRLMPPLTLDTSNFEQFLQTVVSNCFQDILDPETAAEYKGLLEVADTHEGIRKAKDYLVRLVKTSLVLIINSNSPKDRISFEKYQLNRKFEILESPLLLQRTLVMIKTNCNLRDLIISEIFARAADPSYKIIESLWSVELILNDLAKSLRRYGHFDEWKRFFISHQLDRTLYEHRSDAQALLARVNKLYDLNMQCFGDNYEQLVGYLKENCV